MFLHASGRRSPPLPATVRSIAARRRPSPVSTHAGARPFERLTSRFRLGRHGLLIRRRASGLVTRGVPYIGLRAERSRRALRDGLGLNDAWLTSCPASTADYADLRSLSPSFLAGDADHAVRRRRADVRELLEREHFSRSYGKKPARPIAAGSGGVGDYSPTRCADKDTPTGSACASKLELRRLGRSRADIGDTTTTCSMAKAAGVARIAISHGAHDAATSSPSSRSRAQRRVELRVLRSERVSDILADRRDTRLQVKTFPNSTHTRQQLGTQTLDNVALARYRSTRRAGCGGRLVALFLYRSCSLHRWLGRRRPSSASTALVKLRGVIVPTAPQRRQRHTPE